MEILKSKPRKRVFKKLGLLGFLMFWAGSISAYKLIYTTDSENYTRRVDNSYNKFDGYMEHDKVTSIAWTGDISNAWEILSNWNPSLRPDSFNNVYIFSATNLPTISDTEYCYNLVLQPNCTLTIGTSGSQRLEVFGDSFTNNGVIKTPAYYNDSTDLLFRDKCTIYGNGVYDSVGVMVRDTLILATDISNPSNFGWLQVGIALKTTMRIYTNGHELNVGDLVNYGKIHASNSDIYVSKYFEDNYIFDAESSTMYMDNTNSLCRGLWADHTKFYNLVIRSGTRTSSGYIPDIDTSGSLSIYSGATLEFDTTLKGPTHCYTAFYGDSIKIDGVFKKQDDDLYDLRIYENCLFKGSGICSLDVRIVEDTTIIPSGADLKFAGKLKIDGVLDINNATVTVTGDSLIINGNFDMDGGSVLKLGGSTALCVNSGGKFKAVGTSGNSAVITRDGISGYYTFKVNSGGSIEAKYYKFEYMDANGIYIKDGATIVKYPVIGGKSSDSCGLSYGSFAYYGASDGTMLTVNNNQGAPGDTLFFENVRFDTIWSEGVDYNVIKDMAQGLVKFRGKLGNFWGEDYESDIGGSPGRIIWEPQPLAVKLVSFEAIPDYEAVLLQWITESESDNAKWLLARSEEAEEQGSKGAGGRGVKDLRIRGVKELRIKVDEENLHPTPYTLNSKPYTLSSDWQIIAEVQAEGEGHTYNFVDLLVDAENTYWYMLGDIDNEGDTTWYDDWFDSAIPKSYQIVKFNLKQSYPNPFTDRTHIEYTIPGKLPSSDKLHASLKIYDISGRLVKTIIDKRLSPDYYEVTWDGKTGQGRSLPAGVYFYRFQIGREVSSKKLILIR